MHIQCEHMRIIKMKTSMIYILAHDICILYFNKSREIGTNKTSDDSNFFGNESTRPRALFCVGLKKRQTHSWQPTFALPGALFYRVTVSCRNLPILRPRTYLAPRRCCTVRSPLCAQQKLLSCMKLWEHLFVLFFSLWGWGEARGRRSRAGCRP